MRFLTGVTITGADDAVDVCDLESLSAEFPFVEWGILASRSHEGCTRYPTSGWRFQLNRFTGKKALHVCGEYARQAMKGDPVTVLHAKNADASRIQINGWAPSHGSISIPVISRYEVVYQARDERSFDAAERFARVVLDLGGMASVLWDPSGGRGIRGAFARLPPTDVPIGYAGGIGPDNIGEVLDALADRGPCWIDMESNVRTRDVFDLAKVRRVLEAAAPFVMEAP